MNTKDRRIEEARKLGKRGNAWRQLARLASRIARRAEARSRAYAYEQNVVLNELYKDVDTDEIEARKEYNRSKFEIES